MRHPRIDFDDHVAQIKAFHKLNSNSPNEQIARTLCNLKKYYLRSTPSQIFKQLEHLKNKHIFLATEAQNKLSAFWGIVIGYALIVVEILTNLFKTEVPFYISTPITIVFCFLGIYIYRGYSDWMADAACKYSVDTYIEERELEMLEKILHAQINEEKENVNEMTFI